MLVVSKCSQDIVFVIWVGVKWVREHWLVWIFAADVSLVISNIVLESPLKWRGKAQGSSGFPKENEYFEFS